MRVWRSRIVEDVLAGGLLGTEAGGLDGGSGLVVHVALLDQESDTAVLAGNDTDCLFQHYQYRLLREFVGAFVFRTLLAMPPSFYPS
jgi:hypothetical protein